MSTIKSAVTITGNLYYANSLSVTQATNISSFFDFNSGQAVPSSFYYNSGDLYINAINLSLGVVNPTYQLDMSTDNARKLTTITWLTGSDIRIKSDVTSANLDRCVDIVKSLDLKYFKWNYPDTETDDTHSLGWIAQDVKLYFPKSVKLTPSHGFDDFHNLDSDQLTKVMYGALKKMIHDTY